MLARWLLCPANIAAMNPISSRISGAYSGVTFSPRQARIIFSISSLPGSVIAGRGPPSRIIEHGGADFILDSLGHRLRDPGSGGRRAWACKEAPALRSRHMNQNISRTRDIASAMADVRSSFLRGASMFMVFRPAFPEFPANPP